MKTIINDLNSLRMGNKQRISTLNSLEEAIKILQMIDDCNEHSATKCFECINKIKGGNYDR